MKIRAASPPERRLVRCQGSLLRRLLGRRHCGKPRALLLLLLEPECLRVALEHGLVAHLLLAVALLLAEPVLLPSLEVGRLFLRRRGEVDGRRAHPLAVLARPRVGLLRPSGWRWGALTLRLRLWLRLGLYGRRRRRQRHEERGVDGVPRRRQGKGLLRPIPVRVLLDAASLQRVLQGLLEGGLLLRLRLHVLRLFLRGRRRERRRDDVDTRAPLLLVFEGEPSLLVRRVGGVLGQPTLLWCEQRATPVHLVVVRQLGPRNRRHRDPVWIQMPMVRQRHVGVGEGLPVLPVPPCLVHRDVQAPASRTETRRRWRGRGSTG